MLNTPFPSWPSFTQEEADAIAHTLLSNKVNYWTGNECREFEKEFAASPVPAPKSTWKKLSTALAGNLPNAFQ
jgi:dTDP-4-amino-4,6-dideoxygalactose transaminase